VVKVKEPQPSEYEFYAARLDALHLPAPGSRGALTRDGEVRSDGIAYETVNCQRHLPLLTPMSDCSCRMAIQVGAHYLER